MIFCCYIIPNILYDIMLGHRRMKTFRGIIFIQLNYLLLLIIIFNINRVDHLKITFGLTNSICVSSGSMPETIWDIYLINFGHICVCMFMISPRFSWTTVEFMSLVIHIIQSWTCFTRATRIVNLKVLL